MPVINAVFSAAQLKKSALIVNRAFRQGVA
jgi:hypothetical protein